MHKLALGMAASFAALMITSPAAAEETRQERFSAVGAAPQRGVILPGSGFFVDVNGNILAGGGRNRRGGGSGGDGSGIWVNGGEWAHYNNQTFNSNSYNDWWHESPRSQPAWVRNNHDCSRQWFAGNVLRC